MDELPELPFEKVLSYLSLQDRLKARAVSRRWYHQINSFRVNTLCYSERPAGFIREKNRWVGGAFARNFISSTRFESFFNKFNEAILSNLKHLRLCDLDLSGRDPSAFTRTLNSFGQLEELDIIRVQRFICGQQSEFKLTLPMLHSIHLEQLGGVEKLTLDAPRLQKVNIVNCYSHLRVEIVHGESVERLLVDRLEYTEVKKLKKLQCLNVSYLRRDSTLLSSLKQLKEIHTNDSEDVSDLFEQKRRYDRADLKIYLCGLLLNGPDDPARNALRGSSSGSLASKSFRHLVENPSRLADEIPFFSYLYNHVIGGVAPGLEIDLLKRFTDLKEIRVNRPVEDIQRFLDLLNNFENIVDLEFWCAPPQDLFDRLPEHCAVQNLTIRKAPSDLQFLFQLKHLIHLKVYCSIDTDTVRKAFEEIPVLSYFEFQYLNQWVTIELDRPKQFRVWIDYKKKTVSDVNAAIEFIAGKEPQKRKAELE